MWRVRMFERISLHVCVCARVCIYTYIRMYDVIAQVFCDFLPGTVFANQASLIIRHQLGDGGFGTVYKAFLHSKVGGHS